MKRIKNSFEHVFIVSHLIQWTLFVIPVSLSVGTLVAWFLWLLDKAIHFRYTHLWLLWLLPVAGVAIHFLYQFSGKNAEGGNNLIMDEIHEPGGGVPARMAPLVIVATIITHLFGGSAGREGTAVQVGGSLANFFARQFKLTREDVRMLLTSGVAAGFGAVFGTPITGAIFALEVLALGRIKHDALLPCFIASFLADITCGAWGIHHTQYHILFASIDKTYFKYVHFDLLLLFKVIGAGILFGLAGFAFAETAHTIKNYSNKWIKQKWMIPVAGGLIIITLSYIIGTQDYLSLGVTNPNKNGVSIISSFHEGGATYFSWFWKLLFTAITLGMGFKGGEVTPLFFIGAALGNTLGVITGAPIDLMAGLGFIAVFAGATNTPIACTFMGIELFGGENVIYYAVACFTAYYFSGHSGIYHAQRVAVSKVGNLQHYTDKTLHDVRDKRIKKRKQWLKKIKSHSLGKLEIYIEPAHKVRHGDRTLFRKLFPKSAYMHIVAEAKKDGIINASAHSTHTSFSTDGNIITFSAEGDNSKLAMCVELIDKKEKLENFFLKHKDLLQSKIVIYKEVEFWDID